MGQINRIAEGLLDLFVSKNQGKNPQDFIENVQPTLDMFQFYSPDRLSHAFDSTLATIGNAAIITVPAGEVWFITTMDISWVSAAVGRAFSGIISVDRIPLAAASASQAALFAPGNIISVQVNEVINQAFVLPRPFVVSGGQRILMTVARSSAPGLFTVAVNVSYVKLFK